MKKLFLLLFFITVISPSPTLAHVLETDGSIGAILHITPNDDPRVGQQSTFLFEFKDKDEQFDATNCNCTVSIKKDDTPIFTQQMLASSESPIQGSIFYTFEETGAYTVTITGVDRTNTFSNFTLEYPIRINKALTEPKSSDNSTPTYLYILTTAAVLALGFFIFKMVATKNKA